MAKRTPRTIAGRPENAGENHAPTRDDLGRFVKGASGNRAGKPRGCRNGATEAALALLDGEAQALTRRAVDIALRGEGKDAVLALRLCLERVAPAPRDRAVRVELPEVTSAVSLTDALAALLSAVASGKITPAEGNAMATLAEGIGRALDREDFEVRLAALEARLTDGGGQ